MVLPNTRGTAVVGSKHSLYTDGKLNLIRGFGGNAIFVLLQWSSFHNKRATGIHCLYPGLDIDNEKAKNNSIPQKKVKNSYI